MLLLSAVQRLDGPAEAVELTSIPVFPLFFIEPLLAWEFGG